MLIIDTVKIAAPPDAVHRALLDPEVLRACLPGRARVSGNARAGFRVELALKLAGKAFPIGSIVRVKEGAPGQGMVFTVPGRVRMEIALAPDSDGDAPRPERTALSYETELNDDSPLVRFGGVLLRRAARREADRFFGALQDQLARRAEGETR